ncbi:molybdate ABC transporter substrate-binding protein [Rhodobacteraceae bacterium 2CG4]|uniref:Molybdate ABC transporter substrate-binding protein n=1 Tax=Halovulum marinum TaxID=2662447 RepID=A0A6L5Z2C4_9RHOB|nr:molybdate ABC transporter substrate-binding protein [Halovulum marinum]MSU90419.1 molybdate ABC transporter substrate-binding protein [Halovulum marinum]
MPLRLALLALLALAAPAAAGTVTVFAAASTREALDRAAEAWEAETGHEVVLSYAGSSALARQIQQGAPAQLFLSANADWMDVLQDEGLIDPDTRSDLLGNRLVLIAAPGAVLPDPLAPGALARALDDERLAMALVDAVPAGIYGKAALAHLGLWDALAPKVAQADNVRAALALVARGEAPFGVVYATDAAAEPAVTVAARFPPDSHPPIRYPLAAMRDAGPEARALLRWLNGPQAAAIFRDHGFTVPDRAP